ncbi:MAG: hypothetical protein AVO38_06160 [delta proteobacterium ML8_D]|jgi:hypothetical protein|nr:MAG: hypothetical protein AVO38_06160 [delta proteobacterium ML8_D]
METQSAGPGIKTSKLAQVEIFFISCVQELELIEASIFGHVLTKSHELDNVIVEMRIRNFLNLP